jgi:hypothetical protein
MDTPSSTYDAIQLPIDISTGHKITALYAADPIDEAEQSACAAAPGCVWTEVVIDGEMPTNRVLRMPLDLTADIYAQVESRLNS